MNIQLNSNLKDGLAGIIRVKNEARFIEPCVETCINALDEIIIVYNDCVDETPTIVEKLCKRYPNKVKSFAYNYKVLSHNLTKTEFEYALSLPEDSPRLHCNQCNYGLSKVTYKYAVKIDVDQLYFTEELNAWKRICSKEDIVHWNMSFIVGWLFMIYFSLYRRLSAKIGTPFLKMLPNKLVDLCIKPYLNFAKWQLQRGKVCISLSGLNLFKDDAWYVPFDKYNIHPPYNGSGDTLIFKLSNETFFYRCISMQSNYSVIETFNCPCKVMYAGPIWFHLHANREYCHNKVKKVKDEHPELFVLPEDFVNMTYREVHDKMDFNVPTLFQRILFALIHRMGINVIKKNLFLLRR